MNLIYSKGATSNNATTQDNTNSTEAIDLSQFGVSGSSLDAPQDLSGSGATAAPAAADAENKTDDESAAGASETSDNVAASDSSRPPPPNDYSSILGM